MTKVIYYFKYQLPQLFPSMYMSMMLLFVFLMFLFMVEVYWQKKPNFNLSVKSDCSFSGDYKKINW